MKVLKMADLDLQGQRVLIREDLNVPVSEGKVTSDARILAALPSIKMALAKGAKVMVMSHLGRPTEGALNPEDSLAPIVDYLRSVLDVPVRLVSDYLDGVAVQNNEVVVFENVRCNLGEKKNDAELSKKLAALCDVYVNDAFGTAHRAQASTHGVAQYAKIACAGPLMVAELEALSRVLENPARPFVAIVGGSKVSTKLQVLSALSEKVDQLIVGGGIANTFMAASGLPIGQSLVEINLIEDAKKLIQKTEQRGAHIPIPQDVVVGQAFSATSTATTKTMAEVAESDMIFDIGPETAKQLAEMIKNAGTIIWNGPVGVFEFEQFSHGTQVLAHAIADSSAFSIAGGGDTLAAVDKYQIKDKISYISTGGGAFLEFVEGKILPAVEILEQRCAEPSS